MSLQIVQPTIADLPAIHQLLRKTIVNTFLVEEIEGAEQEIQDEITSKLKAFEEGLLSSSTRCFHLLAFLNDDLVGCIGYGPPNALIRNHLQKNPAEIVEIKDAYVHPVFQRRGIGTALLAQILWQLQTEDREGFFLDCGFSQSQAFWEKKLGPPTIVLTDYWGQGADHLIWEVRF